MNYASLGVRAKLEIAGFREAGIRLRLSNPAARKFAHDIDVWTKLEEFDDHLVGRLVSKATATNLRSLGYKRSRSETGETVITMFTAGLVPVRAVFGGSVIWTSDGITQVEEANSRPWNMRGILNRTDVREMFCREMDNLVLKLLALEEPSEPMSEPLARLA